MHTKKPLVARRTTPFVIVLAAVLASQLAARPAAAQTYEELQRLLTSPDFAFDLSYRIDEQNCLARQATLHISRMRALDVARNAGDFEGTLTSPSGRMEVRGTITVLQTRYPAASFYGISFTATRSWTIWTGHRIYTTDSYEGAFRFQPGGFQGWTFIAGTFTSSTSYDTSVRGPYPFAGVGAMAPG